MEGKYAANGPEKSWVGQSLLRNMIFPRPSHLSKHWKSIMSSPSLTYCLPAAREPSAPDMQYGSNIVWHLRFLRRIGGCSSGRHMYYLVVYNHHSQGCSRRWLSSYPMLRPSQSKTMNSSLFTRQYCRTAALK